MSLLERFKFKKAIIKPAISGAARHTYLVNKNNYKDYENIFQKLLKSKCMLFQEYMFNISEGEISLIMIGNEFYMQLKKQQKKETFEFKMIMEQS